MRLDRWVDVRRGIAKTWINTIFCRHQTFMVSCRYIASVSKALGYDHVYRAMMLCRCHMTVQPLIFSCVADVHYGGIEKESYMRFVTIRCQKAENET